MVNTLTQIPDGFERWRRSCTQPYILRSNKYKNLISYLFRLAHNQQMIPCILRYKVLHIITWVKKCRKRQIEWTLECWRLCISYSVLGLVLTYEFQTRRRHFVSNLDDSGLQLFLCLLTTPLSSVFKVSRYISSNNRHYSAGRIFPKGPFPQLRALFTHVRALFRLFPDRCPISPFWDLNWKQNIFPNKVLHQNEHHGFLGVCPKIKQVGKRLPCPRFTGIKKRE